MANLISSPQTITDSWENVGTAQIADNRTIFPVAVSITPNNSEDIQFRLLLTTSDSLTQFPLPAEKIYTDGNTQIFSEIKTIKEFVSTEQTIPFYIPTGIKEVQLQVQALTVGGTAATLDEAISIKSYDNSIIGTRSYIPNGSKINQINICTGSIGATKGFMLVDLSDTTNWKHTETGFIKIKYMQISISPDATFAGLIDIGFLSNVDADNGDFNIIDCFALTKKSVSINVFKKFNPNNYCAKSACWFGPTTANDATWQTDVNLQGPDGATSYPSGDGDLVLKVIRTAGTVEVGLMVGYTTHDF